MYKIAVDEVNMYRRNNGNTFHIHTVQPPSSESISGPLPLLVCSEETHWGCLDFHLFVFRGSSLIDFLMYPPFFESFTQEDREAKQFWQARFYDLVGRETSAILWARWAVHLSMMAGRVTPLYLSLPTCSVISCVWRIVLFSLRCVPLKLISVTSRIVQRDRGRIHKSITFGVRRGW